MCEAASMPASFVCPVFLGGTLTINHHPCENNIKNGFVEPERLNAHLNVMNLDLSSKHELEQDHL